MGKYVHLCPHCGSASGVKGGYGIPELECISCEEPVTWTEWKNSEIKPKPGYEDYFKEHPEEWEKLVSE